MPEGFASQLPLNKSSQSIFFYDSNGCQLDQMISTEVDRRTEKSDVIVTYDRTFCSRLGPIVRRMGTQNLEMCTGLISQAESALKARNNELNKEGKSIKVMDYPKGYTDKLPGVLGLTSLILLCSSGGVMGSPFLRGGLGLGLTMPGMDEPTWPSADEPSARGKIKSIVLQKDAGTLIPDGITPNFQKLVD